MAVLGLIFLTGGWASAFAQALADPTRPPAKLTAEVESAGSAEPAAPVGNRLQSIMRREGAKPRALVNGQWLESGQKHGDLRLVKIAADRVVIAGPQGRETLRLNPDVDIKASAPATDQPKKQGSKK